jgi:hypothetical protein
MPDVARVIYIIGPNKGPLKVGSATDVRSRLASIQTGHPHKLMLYGSWAHENAYQVEAEAHRLLSSSRLVGEWFSAPKEDAALAIKQAILNIDSRAGALFAPVAVSDPGDTVDYPPADAVDIGPEAISIPAEQHRLGYARTLREASAAKQADWMIRSGVAEEDVFFETDDASRLGWHAILRDCRDGDVLLLWSIGAIEPTTAAELRNIVTMKNTDVIFANGDSL